jgi:hypothetical protein
MLQRKPQRTGNEDPAKPLREETDQERREEEGGGSGKGARRDRDGQGDGRVSRQRGWRAALEGRQPSPEPDVFVDVPKVQVDEIHLNDERLDAHLALQTRLANLVQLVAGVHVHLEKVELDAKVVEAEALHKVRLENLYDIVDRALATIDHNPKILESLLKTADTAVDDIGQTAPQALGPGGAPTKAVDDPAEGVSDATKDVGAAAGQAAGKATEAARGGGKDAGQQGDAGRRRSREGEDETRRGTRRSRPLEGGRGDDQVGRAAWEATDRVGLVAGEAVRQVRRAADEAAQRVGQPAVAASGKATWTPRKAGEAQGAGQRRRRAPRGSREGKTKRGSKRGTLLRRRTATARSSSAARPPGRPSPARCAPPA